MDEQASGEAGRPLQEEDADTARLIERAQAGERELFGTVYTRYFERMFGYFRTALRDVDEAEDATQQVFTDALAALPSYKPRPGRPFRAWLFAIARNRALDELKRLNKLVLTDPAEMEAHAERPAPELPGPGALDWITDFELLLFVERLPLPQQQVLLLRFLLDLKSEDAAEALGMTAAQVRSHQRRALEFLADRLTAIGRGPTGPDRPDKPVKMRRWGTQARVLRNRRFALWD